MARAVVIYGARGAGKTTTTLRLAEELGARGLRAGGFYQRTTADEQHRRGYDLVHLRGACEALPLAREAPAPVDPAAATACSLVFSADAFAMGRQWLRDDEACSDLLVIDEVSKLEVAGKGHHDAVRWALGLDERLLVLLSVRADLLYGVVERFDLEPRIVGHLEIPATRAQLAELARCFGAPK